MIKGTDVKKMLKAHGMDIKKISVRIAYGGYSKSINVTIKDITVNRNEVSKLVKQKYQEISYDKYNGEILQGGNTFVFVKYDYDTIEKAVLQRLDKAKTLYNQIAERNAHHGITVFEDEEIEALFFYRDSIVSLRAKYDDTYVNQRVHVSSTYDLAETLTYLENGLYETQKKETFCD